MFIKKPLAKGYPMTLSKWNISAAAPDFTLLRHSGKSRRLAEGFQSQSTFLVCSIGFALPIR
jgi:hypothetical protein